MFLPGGIHSSPVVSSEFLCDYDNNGACIGARVILTSLETQMVETLDYSFFDCVNLAISVIMIRMAKC